LIVSLFPGQQKQLDKLKAQRIALTDELTDVINEFGPKLYNDFDQVRDLFFNFSPKFLISYSSYVFSYHPLLRLLQVANKGYGDARVQLERSMPKA